MDRAIAKFPQTVLALRGSGGLSLEAEWSVCGLCGWSARTHFCCDLSQTVRVTLKFSRRNSRSRKKIQKNTIVSPRDFPWRFPEPPRDLDGRKCPKIDENWFEWVRHESPRAHIRRGRSYGLSDASGTLPDPFSARFRPILSNF